MKALVVYESMFGNTEEVARAVAEGVGETMDVSLHEVSTAPAPITDLVDLVVVGGPTHAFSLSRPSTRADAIDKGADPGRGGHRPARVDRSPAQGTALGVRRRLRHPRRPRSAGCRAPPHARRSSC